MSIRKVFLTIAKDSGIYGMGNVLTNFTAFLMVPLYINFLTPSDYGIISTATTITGIMAILTRLGFDNGYRRFYYDCKDEEDRKKLFSTLVFSLVIFNGIILMIWWFGGKTIFSLLIKDVPFYPYIWLVMLAVFLRIPYRMQMFYFLTLNKAKSYALLGYIVSFLNISIIILFVAFFKEGSLGKLKADLIAYIFATLLCLIWLQKNISFSFDFNKLRVVLFYSIPLLPSMLSNWTIKLSDRLFIAHYLTMSSVGTYSLGYRIASIIEVMMLAVNTACISRFYALSKDNPKEAVRIFSKYNTYFILLTVTLGLILSIFAKEVLELLTSNKDYHEAAKIIPLISIGLIFWALYIMPVNQLSYTKDTGIITKVLITMAFLNILLNFVLIPRFGMFGAAYSTIFTYVVRYIWILFEAQKKYKMEYEMAKIVVMLGTFFLLVGLNYYIQTEDILISLLTKTMLLAVFAFVAWYTTLRNDVTIEKEFKKIFTWQK